MTIKYEILKEKVFYFENAIPNVNSLLNHIINTNNEVISDWQDWNERPELGGRDYGYSKYIQGSNITSTTNSETAQNIASLLEIINSACKIYQQYNPTIPERQFTKDLVLLKYHTPEDEYKASVLAPHVDWPDPTEDEHTILVYYNDDYSDGEVVFDKLNLTIKPKAGSVLIFSATDLDLIHHTNEITSGLKHFTLHMWLAGSIKGLYKK